MLYLVATPIGNLEDISLRALRVLKEADYVLAEDTRKSGILLKHYGIKKPLVSFFDHNEIRKTPQIIEDLKAGKNIALITDAGSPTISDPGFRLVRAVTAEKLEFTALPGPSSVITALSLTSIGHEKFIFLGYLPRKDGERKRILEQVQDLAAATVVFESPFRLAKSLEAIKETLGNRQVAIARELTKKFEEVWEGYLAQAILHFNQHKPRGEFTIIIDRRQ